MFLTKALFEFLEHFWFPLTQIVVTVGLHRCSLASLKGRRIKFAYLWCSSAKSLYSRRSCNAVS